MRCRTRPTGCSKESHQNVFYYVAIAPEHGDELLMITQIFATEISQDKETQRQLHTGVTIHELYLDPCAQEGYYGFKRCYHFDQNLGRMNDLQLALETEQIAGHSLQDSNTRYITSFEKCASKD